MALNKNFHEGHRERLLNRFLENSDGTPDHELLEILLFTMIPRKDTNLIAHKLLHAFGNLDKVFSVPAKELMAVDGVGKRTACELEAIGKIINRVLQSKKPSKKRLQSFYNIKEMVIEDFATLKEERFIIYLLDESFNKMLAIEFEDRNRSNVTADVPDVAKALALHKPKSAVIAHNHPSGNVNPSETDDLTTKKMSLICSLHGVELIDHVVVSGSNVYSYHMERRLEEIKSQVAFNQLFKN